MRLVERMAISGNNGVALCHGGVLSVVCYHRSGDADLEAHRRQAQSLGPTCVQIGAWFGISYARPSCGWLKARKWRTTGRCSP